MEIQREFTWPERASRQWQLLNDFQRDFPLCAEPYAELARQMGGIGEEEILSQLKDWSQTGVLSRVGAVFRPQALGPSTLAAVKVCPPRLDEVAQFINSFSEVNHNYQREADLNLWFVVTAPTEERLQEVLLSIGEKAGFPVQDCRLLYEFRIDLGFSLMEEEPQADFNEQQAQGPAQLSDRQRQICRLLEEGLPLVTRPFDPWAKSLDLTTEELIQEIQTLVEQKIIRRFGLVLRHRPMGYQHNAMTVFRVPQERVLEVGRGLTRYPFVTLCYERNSSPVWPFNLYCMIHGKSRDEVESQIARVREELSLGEFPHEVLFSTKAFKQRGARYLSGRRRSEDEVQAILLNRLQQGIEVVNRPFQKLSLELGLSEEEICQRLQRMRESGLLTRFGPMYNIEKMGGAFSLVAMEVPAERWDEVLQKVNAFPEVAHNYEREHRLNMWFVLAALPAEEKESLLRQIETATGLKTYDMPKLKEFYLNLQLESGERT